MKKLLIEKWKTIRETGLAVSWKVKIEKSIRELSGDAEIGSWIYRSEMKRRDQ